MRKALTVLAAAAIAGAAIATPTTADARWGRGGAFFGGLAAGAIIGGALAAPYAYGYSSPYYSYGYYPRSYYGGAGFYDPGPYSCVRRVWNGYRWVRAYVC
jgi:hypothetical protein